MKRFIKDLREKDHFQTVFLCREKNAGTDRNGKSFLSVTVVDRTGQLNGRLFERAAEVAAGFEVGDVVWVKGFVQLYQNRKQIIIHDVRRAADGEYQMPDWCPNWAGIRARTWIACSRSSAKYRTSACAYCCTPR